MFQPAVHYLVEALRICAQEVNLPAPELAGWLLAAAGVLVGLLVLRGHLGR